jgi:dTDP-glucose 4,6-dehydratase
MKHLVLTGCAGFIGINLLEHLITDRKDLLRKYKSVISIDKMGYATEFNNSHYYDLANLFDTEKIKLVDIQSDINSKDFHNRKIVHEPSDKFDILDLASESHVDNSIKDPYTLYEQNASLPAHLCRKFGLANIENFIHISTDEVYGDIDYDVAHNTNSWFRKTTPFAPGNPYSASKVAQDALLMSLQHTFGLNLRIIRMANQFGPWQHPEKMLPASILRSLAGENIRVYGKGKNMRQWTPVKDTVKIIADILESPQQYDVVNHIAAPQDLKSNIEWVETWRNILSDNNIKSSIEYVEDRKGHDKVYALYDCVPWKKDAPSIVDRFEETIKWYIEKKENFGV